jgi:hypothetical protein
MNLITDRTPNDVERWRTLRDKGWERMTEDERREWFGEITTTPAASKGMYTHRDLNRVESAVRVLQERLIELGNRDIALTIKTDWNYTDDFWSNDVTRYFGNIEKLLNRVVPYPSTPSAPKVSQRLDYALANDIEKILVDIDDITHKRIDNRYYAGEIFTGEV